MARREKKRMSKSSIELILAEPNEVDPNVTLGYPTGRSIDDRTLTIGPEATIRSGSTIYAGSTIGAHFATGHNVTIREENVIGDNVGIWSNSVIDYGCRIGNNVRIHTNVYIAQFTVLEDDVFLAPGVSIANDPRPMCAACTQQHGPIIRQGARIGVNVTILPGVEIGAYALIGAGSVVTHDVPPNAVVYGNPARVHGEVDGLSCPLGLSEQAYTNGVKTACEEK
jgi:acetyltransferase-like isoleucine patch superfamily enzyme